MRQQRTPRMPMPAVATTGRAANELPASGYAMIVDGQVKREFSTRDPAMKAAQQLKDRFPKLQVMVYDAENQRNEAIDLAAA
jgi:hypothetical protein